MAAGLLIFPGSTPALGQNGERIAAKLWYFVNNAPGTPKTVYADAGLTTPLAQPIESDALGNFPEIWANTADTYTGLFVTADGFSDTLDDMSASTAANQGIYDATVGIYDDTVVIKGETQDIYDDAVALYGSLTAINTAVTAAQTSATNAANSATASANSATSAANQVTLAAAQVTLATTQAGNAATSATNSANSATAAAGSATAAATSVNQAKAATAAVLMTFSTTTTDADPGAGNMRLNNATPASVTFIYVDDLDQDGNSQGVFWDSLDDSTSAIKGRVTLREGVTGKLAIYNVNGAVVNGTGYRKIPVAYVSGTGTAFTNAATIGFNFSATGDTASTASVGYLAKTGAYTVIAGDWGKVIEATSGTWALTLPTAASVGAGFNFTSKNSGAGLITYTRSGSDLLDGLTSYVGYPGEERRWVSDGSTWHSFVVNPFSYTYTASGSFIWPPGYKVIGGEAIGTGGGGGGGQNNGTGEHGGGGASGISQPFNIASTQYTAGATATVTIGAGGTGGAGSPSAVTVGSDGGSTSLASLVVIPGGKGASTSTSSGATNGTQNAVISANGAAARTSATTAVSGSPSTLGPGGGASGGGTPASGGTSARFGAGGASNSNGADPGGGGGGGTGTSTPNAINTGGTGGRGEIRLWGVA